MGSAGIYEIMRRFYLDSLEKGSKELTLTGSEHNHLKNALRLKEEEEVEVFNGRGIVAKCKVSSIRKLQSDLIVLETSTAEKPHKVDITLINSLTKSIKSEFVVEKATELGVSRIVFFKSERSVVAVGSGSRIENKIKRLKMSAVAASKQCELNYLPQIEIYEKFDDIEMSGGLKIVCYEEENKKTLKDVLVGDNSNNITVMIGPEGGFTEVEIESFKNKGFVTAGIGKNILKAVTAGVAVVAMIGYEKSL